MNAVEIKNVTKSYKSRIAVDDLTLSVPGGCVFGLLGMNGAGKTTTIKMATGLATPTSGEISVFGIDVTKEPEKAKMLLNVSPQETAVAKKLTVKENLVLAARLYGDDKATAEKKAENMMVEFSIKERANERAEKLSGGLCRRLSLAMAVITQPKLLFLDEPTLGLDIVSRRELWRFIKKVKANVTVVLTTHYLEEAESLCDSIAVLRDGKLVGLGTAEELKKQTNCATFEDAFLLLSGLDVAEEDKI